MTDTIDIRFGGAAEAHAFIAALKELITPLTLYNDWSKSHEDKIYTPDYVAKLLEDDPHSILIAWAGSTIAGLIVTRPDNGPLWLDWFGVLPAYRGHGIADQLFERAIVEARQRGILKIWCDTRDTNTYAISIMEKHGFTRAGHLKRHWFGLDFLIWEKFLD